MPLPAKFTPKKPAPKAKPKSKYAGVKSAAPRDPMPHAGRYRMQVCEVEEGYNKGKDTYSHKAKLMIISGAGGEELESEHHKVGDMVTCAWITSGKSATANLPRVKAFTMGAGGFESDEQYDAFDPEGQFIDATTGVENEYSALTIVGRYVDVHVIRGNDVTDKEGRVTGDYYRDYAWTIVPDDVQDTTLSVLAQLEGAAES